MTSLPDDVAPALSALRPISLAELDRTAELRARRDRKFVVGWDAVGSLLEELAGTHRALEIDGRRDFAYDTVYFDSPDLWSFRAHLQRRRNRAKVRTRLYVDTATCAFELKLKGRRGETLKHRVAIEPAAHGTLAAEGRQLLSDHLREVPALAPELHTAYQRITLVADGERATIDHGLRFPDGRMDPGWAIVECKSEAGRGRAEAVLGRTGARSAPCSKFALGVGFARGFHVPELRPLVRRCF